MNRRRWFAVWVLICSAGMLSRVGADEEGIQTVDNAWMKAMRANSIDGIMACYAADAVGWFPGVAEAKGDKAIRAVYEGILASNTVQDVAMSDMRYASMGKLSVGWGKYWIIVIDKASGLPAVWAGRVTEVAERRDDRWVYIVDHVSPEPPQPAPERKK